MVDLNGHEAGNGGHSGHSQGKPTAHRDSSTRREATFRQPFASPHGLFQLSKLSVWWLRLGISIERIRPGHPQQNGHHEPMHLTLKREATHPAGTNILQLQALYRQTVSCGRARTRVFSRGDALAIGSGLQKGIARECLLPLALHALDCVKRRSRNDALHRPCAGKASSDGTKECHHEGHVRLVPWSVHLPLVEPLFIEKASA